MPGHTPARWRNQPTETRETLSNLVNPARGLLLHTAPPALLPQLISAVL